MIHTSITADTTLRDARVALMVAQTAHDKALRLAQTRKQAETLPKVHAARHAVLSAELRAAQ
jgi:hypothetical protein